MPYRPWRCNLYLLNFTLYLLLPPALWAKHSTQTTIASVNHPITLQSIANIELFQSPEGNTIKLINLGETCQFEGIFYYETGKTVEHYWFKGKALIKAQRQDYHYTLGGLANLQNNHGKFDHIPANKLALKIHDPQIQRQFQVYRSLFANSVLQQC